MLEVSSIVTKSILSISLSLLSFLCFAQTPSWTPVAASGQAQERHENGLVQVGNKLILLGGRGQKTVDILDLTTQKWTQGAQPPVEIHHFQAIQLDGFVYILGGLTGPWPNETPLSHILIYDPVEDFWAIGPKIPQNRQRGAAGAVVYNNKIFLINGIINGHSSGWVNWFDQYDPYSDSWTQLPNSPHPRDHFHAVIMEDKLFVAGGRRSGSVENQGFAGTVGPTDIYDFSTGKWETKADIPTPRAGTAAALYNGQPVILGGESNTQEPAHSEVEFFDLTSGTWKSLPDMSSGRHGTQAVFHNNDIIIGAGSANRGGGPELNEFEILSQGAASSFERTPIERGELSVSTSELVLQRKGSSQEIVIKNQNGNQAMLITYLQLDTTGDFEIKNPKETPFLLAPNASFSLEVTAKKTKNNSDATLMIKTIGKSAPLEIKVTGAKN